MTIKEDSTGTAYTIDLQNTRLLLKVEPTAKDLKGATRITANDLEVGDRVQVGVINKSSGAAVPARSVLLMSARDLQQTHQAQAAAWQHSIPGVVTSVDTAGQKLGVTARTPDGAKPLTVDASKTLFTRFSPDTPKTPVPSTFADVQPGDQVRMIGQMDAGSNFAAQRMYSSSARTLLATVSSVSPDGKQVVARDLQTKQSINITLGDESSVRKLPPIMAYALARRLNPDFRGPNGGNSGATPGPGAPPSVSSPAGAKAGEASLAAAPESPGMHRSGGSVGGSQSLGSGAPEAAGNPSGSAPNSRASANGDLSQMLDRLPKISAADLKPGDAVIIAGTPAATSASASVGPDKTHINATTIIAGVEPIFQSASPRQAQSLGDWGASLGGGADAGIPQQ